jgi:hypothetical protein
VESHLLNSPVDEPVYQFLDKKRAEGKNYYVYMTAAANKFLRIYYARIKEFMDSLEIKTPCAEHNNDDASPPVQTEIINPALSAQTNTAFTCEQDSAMQECNVMSSV